MTFEEALLVLGVSTTADADALRRAYLRLLRKHKPERDPEGFRRVREAYEIVTGQIRWGFPQIPPVRVVHLAEPSEPPPQEPRAPDPIEPVEPPATRDPIEPIESPATPDAIDDARTRLEGLPVDAFEERIAIARELVAGQPLESEAYWLLVDELEMAERYAEIPTVLRAAVGAGLPGFHEELVDRYPDHLTAAELTKLTETANPARLAEIGRMLVARDPELGLRTMKSAIDASLAHPDQPAPEVWSVLETIVALHVNGQVHRACELGAAWERWVSETATILRPEDAARWGVIRELGVVCVGNETLPDEVRSAIAEALAQGDLAAAIPRLRAYAATESVEAADVAQLLVARAPMLDRAYSDVLDPTYSASRLVKDFAPRRSRGSPLPWGAVAIAVVAFMRLGARTCETSHYDDRPLYPTRPYALTIDQDGGVEAAIQLLDRLRRDGGAADPLAGANAGASPADATLNEAQSSVDALCHEWSPQTCVAARAAVQAVRDRRCDQAHKRIGGLELSAPLDGPDQIDPHERQGLDGVVAALRAAYDEVCGGP